MSDRGLTPVVGFTILVGITAVGAMSLFVVGMSLADATQSSAEQEQVEQSMAQFADTANEIASSERDTGEFQLYDVDDGTTSVSPDAGHIEMWVENGSSNQTLLDSDIGAYRYETDENGEVVFQGGGVWRASEDGSATMIQPPSFEYRNDGDSTLTYEFVRTTDATGGSGHSEGTINKVNTTDVYPQEGDLNPLEDGIVYLEIESEYCDGWEEFYEQRTPAAVIEGCGDDEQVTVKFSVPFEFPGLEDESVSTGEFTGKDPAGAGFQDTMTDVGEQNMPSPDSLINAKIDDCDRNGGSEISGSQDETIDEGGLYCVNGDMEGDEYNFHTDNGDIEVAIDGDVNPHTVNVHGDGNVTFFASGDYATDVGGNADWGDDFGEAHQLRYMVHSDSIFAEQGGTQGNFNMVGLIYAPNSQFTMANNLNPKGAIIAESIDIPTGTGGGNSDHGAFNPGEEMESITLEFDKGGEPFYYLHVSDTTLEVEDN